MLAVIATSLTIIAVFLPIGFYRVLLDVFLNSLGYCCLCNGDKPFDALTIAPLLSAYFAGTKVRQRILL